MNIETKIPAALGSVGTPAVGSGSTKYQSAILQLHHKFFPKCWCLPHILVHNASIQIFNCFSKQSNILISCPSLSSSSFSILSLSNDAGFLSSGLCLEGFRHITSPTNVLKVLKLLLIGLSFLSRVVVLDVGCHPTYLPCTSEKIKWHDLKVDTFPKRGE